MPGAVSDKDLLFLQSINPSVTQTPKGRALIIDFQKKQEKRKIEIAKMAREYAGKTGAIDQGFYDQMYEYAEANPLAPPVFSTEEDAEAGVAALPNGATFVGPDGEVYVKGAP